jgi:hypothetical protein
MPEKSINDKRIADLEECLAGFMLVAATNGAYIDDEMAEWAKSKLKGKLRTPVQAWREINGH